MWRTQGINLLRGAARPYRLIDPSLARHSSSGKEKSGNGDAKAMNHTEEKPLMQLANGEGLKEKLGKEDREVIPYDELLKICRAMGVVTTADEAAAFARVLDDAGVVLLFRDKVYLHPDKELMQGGSGPGSQFRRP